jgi:hypothetical protein
MQDEPKATDEDFKKVLDRLKPEDFDGHTEFHLLTPEQRLMWLSQAAQFWYECGGLARQSKDPKK